MPYNCEVIERQGELTLGIHTSSPAQDLSHTIPQSIGTVAQYLGQIGQQPTGVPYVAYYNMDMQNLDVEIGFLSANAVPGKGNIKAGSILGGKAASCLHIGPYATVPDAHDALHRWMHDKGYESAGTYYEIYLNDPAVTPPDALETQVFTLLKTS